MFGEWQAFQRAQRAARARSLRPSWNELARSSEGRRLVPFFGGSNLFYPFSMDRALASHLRGAGASELVLHLGSFGFCDSRYVVDTCGALLEAWPKRAIAALIYEVNPNEMPAVSAGSMQFLRRDRLGQEVLDFEEGQLLIRALDSRAPLLHAHLARLAELASRRGAEFPVVILNFESNLRDWAPSVSHFSRLLPAAAQERFRSLLRDAMPLVAASKFGAARPLLTACAELDPEVAVVHYLHAKCDEAAGEAARAVEHYRRARALDPLRGRYLDQSIVSALPEWCRNLGLRFVAIPPVVARVSGETAPGFDAFLDEIHYRPEVHAAIARELWAELRTVPGFGHLPASTPAFGPPAPPVWAATLLDTAVNLLQARPSLFNGERASRAQLYLAEARTLGLDAAVTDQCELKLTLLSGDDEAARVALDRQRALDVDPLSLLLAPAAGSQQPGSSSAMVREMDRELRRALLVKFGVVLSPADSTTDLRSLGVDSLSLLELVLALENHFDLEPSAQALTPEQVSTPDALLAFLSQRTGSQRRLAHAESSRRQALHEARPLRGVSPARLRPHAFLERAARGELEPTLQQVLDRLFREQPELELFRIEGGPGAAASMSVADLDRGSAAYAWMYRESGLLPEDTLHILVRDLRSGILAFIGAVRAGVVPSFGNYPTVKLPGAIFLESFGRVLETLAPGAVLCDDATRALVDALPPGTRPLRVLQVPPLERLLDAPRPPPIQASPQSVAFIQHSSGTTGARKGIAIAHQTLIEHIACLARALDLRADDRIASWLPLYHDMGLVACLLLPLVSAVPATLMTPFDWLLRPVALLEATSRDRASLIWLPNFAFLYLAERVPPEAMAGINLESLRLVTNCSEPITLASLQRFHERFAAAGLSRFALASCYGMAENTFAVTQSGVAGPYLVDVVSRDSLAPGQAVTAPRGVLDELELVSSGRVIEGTTVVILDAKGVKVPDRTVGEIAIRGTSRFAGYHGSPEPLPAGDLFRTGDLGYLDTGHLFVTGRTKDLIIITGRNLYPGDIEEVASRHAGTYPGRAVAIGVADGDRGTERLVLLAEVRPELEGDTARLEQWRQAVRQSLFDMFGVGVPDVIALRRNSLEKTSSGKLARARTRERWLTGGLTDQVLGGTAGRS